MRLSQLHGQIWVPFNESAKLEGVCPLKKVDSDQKSINEQTGHQSRRQEAGGCTQRTNDPAGAPQRAAAAGPEGHKIQGFA